MTVRQTKYSPPKLGHVLLAEDEGLVGKSIQKDLISSDFNADWVENFDDALQALKREDYHALVADIFLHSSQPNGLDLVEEATKMGIPSVIITSALDLEVAKTGLNRGADFLLEKPFKAAELKKVLIDFWENPKNLIALRERAFDQYGLTPKEAEVCRLMLKGLTNQEIADSSGNTLGTVKFYTSQIFQKFEIKNRAELFNMIFPT